MGRRGREGRPCSELLGGRNPTGPPTSEANENRLKLRFRPNWAWDVERSTSELGATGPDATNAQCVRSEIDHDWNKAYEIDENVQLLGFLEVPAPSQDFEAVIRASRPSFRNDHDKVAFLAHASFLSADYVLTIPGKAALGEMPVVPKRPR
ncbi:putative proteasome inhibitor [Nymphaea thermarum]|nr:putative proteasome inhibitor [Nymphaea thermarum]